MAAWKWRKLGLNRADEMVDVKMEIVEEVDCRDSGEKKLPVKKSEVQKRSRERDMDAAEREEYQQWLEYQRWKKMKSRGESPGHKIEEQTQRVTADEDEDEEDAEDEDEDESELQKQKEEDTEDKKQKSKKRKR